MKKRDFLKTTVAAASTVLLPSSLFANVQGNKRLRTAHIGVCLLYTSPSPRDS